MIWRGPLPTNKPSETDWERVRRSIENNDPIAYDPNDPDDGPYDPNDDEACEAYLAQCEIILPDGRRIPPRVAKAS